MLGGFVSSFLILCCAREFFFLLLLGLASSSGRRGKVKGLTADLCVSLSKSGHPSFPFFSFPIIFMIYIERSSKKKDCKKREQAKNQAFFFWLFMCVLKCTALLPRLDLILGQKSDSIWQNKSYIVCSENKKIDSEI